MTTKTSPPLSSKLIYIQNQWGILDRDLASLFGLETKRLLERCKRNETSLSEHDYFQLSNDEINHLWSQIAPANHRINISKKSRSLPFCFPIGLNGEIILF